MNIVRGLGDALADAASAIVERFVAYLPSVLGAILLLIVGWALARAHQERGWEAWGLKLLGDVHAHEPAEVGQGKNGQRGAEQAGDAYRQALALATELGMRPLVAHCHFGLGKLYRQTSKREQAQEHLTTAITMYREMDMRFWLEQAEVEKRALA